MSISHWLLDHPRAIERAFIYTEWALRKLEPFMRKLGLRRFELLFRMGEIITKRPVFDCQMCGVCNLRGTGMTCPLTCPKDIRNGPCGGVRSDGKCEIIPELDCVWVHAWERSEKMRWYRDRILIIHPPLDRSLDGTSAWLNFLEDKDCCAPPGWPDISIPRPDTLLGREHTS
ncbi:MAG: methylenetetrahydrofolate reductase C-terminal domain-containing protein [Anaerolineales bacterium]|nr:methylenetetrahydrofolate reductase C-terminal domain-containing protein [Anaerolineales bacterium]